MSFENREAIFCQKTAAESAYLIVIINQENGYRARRTTWWQRDWNNVRHPAFLRCRLLDRTAHVGTSPASGCAQRYGDRTAVNYRVTGFPKHNALRLRGLLDLGPIWRHQKMLSHVECCHAWKNRVKATTQSRHSPSNPTRSAYGRFATDP